MSHFDDFVRKQFPVQAARVTPMNIEELAEASGGQIKHDGEKEGNFSRDYIKVRVAFPLNEEQTKARIGDWLVKQGRTFKVYKDKSFRSSFELRDGRPVPRDNQSQKKGKPSPANMPQKKAEAPAPDNQVAEAVEQIPAPEETPDGPLANAKVVSANLVEGPPDPSKGVHPVEIVEKSEKLERDETLEAAAEVSQPEQVEEEKKPITLDELNDRAGDPRTADDIYRDARDGNPS